MKTQNRPTRCVLGFLLCMLLAAGGGLSASLIPAARRTARADAPLSIVKIMARPENYINLGVEINCGVATPQNGLNAVETSLGNGDWVPSDWQASLLINGKGIQNWGNVNAISIHANIDWGGLMTDGETSQTPEPPTPGKLWFHLGIAPGSLNMKNDGTDVLTIKKTFPAARQASGVSPDTLLDRDYHYRIIPASDLKDSSGGAASGYIFEEVNTPDYQTRQVAFPETSDGGSYTADGVFDTSYAIEKIVEGGLTGSDGYYYDGDGYASFMADTNNVNLQLALGDGDVIDASEWETADGDRSKINLEFWVLSNKAPESFGVGARQVQLSSSANPDNNPDVTYRWDAYSIYASPVYVPGVWNRMVFKLSEPWGGVSDHNNIDLSSLRFFRHYFVQDAPDADNRVFFSGIRLTESPTQSAVVEQAKVKQFVTVNDAPACVTGDTFTLSAEAVTRLPGFAAQDISDVVFTSDNSDVLTIEGDRATAVGDGVVTVTAMLPGNDKFAAATAQIEITVKKAQSPLEFDTDDGETDTHVFGAPYTLGVTGGSTAGVVTYSVVSDGSTGEGTVRDDILTVIKAGVLVIQATMAGDTEYGDVSCRLTLTVEKSGQAALMALCNEGTLALSSEGGSGTGAVTFEIVSAGTIRTGTVTGSAESGYVLAPSIVGDFVIRALKAGDDNYNSAQSDPITVTVDRFSQNELTITSAATHTYGNGYTITSAGGSGTGAAAAYSIVADGTTGAGTVVGDTLTVTKAGVFKLRAFKEGDVNYYPAESEVFTLTVAKREITVKIQDASMTVSAVVPRFYVELLDGALKEGDTLAAVATFEYSSADGKTAGTFDITATVVSDNYSVTVQKGVLTVNEKPAPPNNGNEGGGQGDANDGGCGGSAAAALSLIALAGILLLKKKF